MFSDGEKVCSKCGMLKPLSEFYKAPRMAGGYSNKCKFCMRQDVKKHYRQNEEYYREYEKKRGETPERRRQRTLACQRHRMKNPEKNKARQRVCDAKRRGKIVEQPCEVCGALNVHAHHEDYSKPLDVIWLCPKHHAWIHN